MRYFRVERYDVADEEGSRDGDWRTFAARVREDRLPATLDKLAVRGYCNLSIDVTDVDTGEQLPEEDWPDATADTPEGALTPRILTIPLWPHGRQGRENGPRTAPLNHE